MGMIVHPIRILNEAEFTHGKLVDLTDMSLYPPRVLKSIKEEAKQQGMDPDMVERMISAAGGGPTETMKLSLTHADQLEAIYKHAIEKYDRAADEAILRADDIVKAYNAAIEAQVDKAYEYVSRFNEAVERGNKTGNVDEDELEELDRRITGEGWAPIVTVVSQIKSMIEEFELSDTEVKKFIIDALYRPSENPTEIRNIIQLRMKYNDLIVGMLQRMLRANYQILGISKDEALMLSEKVASKDGSERSDAMEKIRGYVVENKDQFTKANRIDLRKAGGGVMFITGESLGSIEDLVSIDRMLQLMLEHDCIVVGHGNTDRANAISAAASRKSEEAHRVHMNKKRAIDREYQKKIRELRSRRNDFYEKSINVTTKASDRAYELFLDAKYGTETQDADPELAKELEREYARIRKKEEALSDHYMKLGKEARQKEWSLDEERDVRMSSERDRINREMREIGEEYKELIHRYGYTKAARWTIQPVKTLSGGPFTDVNDLVRQLIKEGFKDIVLISCNPGGKSLAKDIKDTKGVKITFSNTTLLGESATCLDPGDPYHGIESAILETQSHLMEVCTSCGFYYGDDAYLEECASFFDGAGSVPLSEGVISNMWTKLVEYIKRFIGFLVGLFKRILEFFKKIVEKIKGFFKRILGNEKVSGRLVRPVRSGAILVENASSTKITAKSWQDLEKETISACETISKAIQKLEKAQTENARQLQQFAEKESHSINESANARLDSIISIITKEKVKC